MALPRQVRSQGWRTLASRAPPDHRRDHPIPAGHHQANQHKRTVDPVSQIRPGPLRRQPVWAVANDLIDTPRILDRHPRCQIKELLQCGTPILRAGDSKTGQTFLDCTLHGRLDIFAGEPGEMLR